MSQAEREAKRQQAQEEQLARLQAQQRSLRPNKVAYAVFEAFGRFTRPEPAHAHMRIR